MVVIIPNYPLMSCICFSDSGLKYYAISRQEYRENLQKSSQICYKRRGILRFLASEICYFRTDIGGSFPGPIVVVMTVVVCTQLGYQTIQQ